jgi:hypothetical protein
MKRDPVIHFILQNCRLMHWLMNFDQNMIPEHLERAQRHIILTDLVTSLARRHNISNHPFFYPVRKLKKQPTWHK